MIVNHHEAKNFRCPTSAGNVNPHDPHYRFCAGNKCVLWRWVSDKKGYCGLAPAQPPVDSDE